MSRGLGDVYKRQMLILICGGFSMIAGACMLLGYAIGRKKRQPESKPVQPKPLSEEQQKQRASEMETLSRQILQYRSQQISFTDIAAGT